MEYINGVISLKIFRSEKIKYFNNNQSQKTIKDKFRNSFNFKYEFDIKKSSSREISSAIIKLAKQEILIPITNY